MEKSQIANMPEVRELVGEARIAASTEAYLAVSSDHDYKIIALFTKLIGITRYNPSKMTYFFDWHDLVSERALHHYWCKAMEIVKSEQENNNDPS